MHVKNSELNKWIPYKQTIHMYIKNDFNLKNEPLKMNNIQIY